MNVWNVYRSPLKGRARRDAVAARNDRVSIYKLSDCETDIVVPHGPQELAVEPEDECSLGFAQPDAILSNRVEHGLQVEGGTADNL